MSDSIIVQDIDWYEPEIAYVGQNDPFARRVRPIDSARRLRQMRRARENAIFLNIVDEAVGIHGFYQGDINLKGTTWLVWDRFNRVATWEGERVDFETVLSIVKNNWEWIREEI